MLEDAKTAITKAAAAALTAAINAIAPPTKTAIAKAAAAALTAAIDAIAPPTLETPLGAPPAPKLRYTVLADGTVMPHQTNPKWYLVTLGQAYLDPRQEGRSAPVTIRRRVLIDNSRYPGAALRLMRAGGTR